MTYQQKLVFIICSLITQCSPTDDVPTLPIIVNEATHTIVEREVVNQINEYRLDNNLGELNTDNEAQSQASNHTRDMVNSNKVSHEGYPSRVSYLTEQGAVDVGEIVAGGYRTVESTMNAFLTSEGHNSVIIKGYSHIGVSVEDKYYTIIFTKYN